MCRPIPTSGTALSRPLNNRLQPTAAGRFGLVYVDFKTQKRTPKLSAAWFHEAAKRNAVV